MGDQKTSLFHEAARVCVICALITMATWHCKPMISWFQAFDLRPPLADTMQVDYYFAQLAYMGDLVNRYFHTRGELPNEKEMEDLHSFMNSLRSQEEIQSDPDGTIGLARFMEAQKKSSDDLMAILAERVSLYLEKRGLDEMSRTERDQLNHLLPMSPGRHPYGPFPPFWTRGYNFNIWIDTSKFESNGHFSVGMPFSVMLSHSAFKRSWIYLNILLSMSETYYTSAKDGYQYLILIVPSSGAEAM